MAPCSTPRPSTATSPSASCWDQGIALMHKGEKGVLLLPSALGYGSDGAGSDIPPNAVLRFEVELLDVQ
jgi:FKBP-type peptidyl-prolyl cis-trans isomerase FkpA